MTEFEQIAQQFLQVEEKQDSLRKQLCEMDQRIFWTQIKPLFAAHPQLDFISWRQESGWNGHYYETDINDFRVNHYACYAFNELNSFASPLPYVILDEPEESYLKSEQLPYSQATFVELFPRRDIFPAVKSLHVLFYELYHRYGSPFFESAFGMKSKVRIDKEGVLVKPLWENASLRDHRADELGML